MLEKKTIEELEELSPIELDGAFFNSIAYDLLDENYLKIFMMLGCSLEYNNIHNHIYVAPPDFCLTPLRYAIFQKKFRIVNLLIKAGANVDIEETERRYLCNIASSSIEIIELFLNLGLNINARDQRGRTMIHYAAQLRYIEIVNYLIKKRTFLNIRDFSGDTALHLAIPRGSSIGLSRTINVLRLLLKSGAFKQIKNFEGRYPWDLIEDYYKKNIPELNPHA